MYTINVGSSFFVKQGSISSKYLCAAFTPVAPQILRTQPSSQYLFTLLGSTRLKAVRRTLMKLSPEWNFLCQIPCTGAFELCANGLVKLTPTLLSYRVNWRSWRGRGRALWLRRWCGRGWRRGLDEDNPETFPVSHRPCSPGERPWTRSLGPGPDATPDQQSKNLYYYFNVFNVAKKRTTIRHLFYFDYFSSCCFNSRNIIAMFWSEIK